jgi:ubiquinone/menaquinone biosynthesis C-methylase UbiE
VTAESDRSYLTEQQYKTDANLAARQSIYAYQQPRREIWNEALDLAGLRGDEYMLDVGCGNGTYLAALHARGHRGPIAGMDLSHGMLAAAAPRRGSATLFQGDVQHLPFADNTFDVSLAMHMLYHVPDRALAIRELRRATKPGAVAVVATNSEAHLHELGAVWEQATGAPHTLSLLSFTLESGRAELEAAFESVTRHDCESELVVTEIEPILVYLRSTRSFVTGMDYDAALDDVAPLVAEAIDRDGAFRIRTFAGTFVCR